jgi:hypothetical protein
MVVNRDGTRSNRRLLWAALAAALMGESSTRGEEPVSLPPVIPHDSVFSDAQRGPRVAALISPPASEHGPFLPTDEPFTAPGQPTTLGPPPPELLEAQSNVDIPFLHKVVGPDRFIRQMNYRKTFLPLSDDLGVIDIAVEAIMSPKWQVFGAPLWITPYFTWHVFDGTHPFPLPEYTYDTGVELRHLRKITPRLTGDISVAPSVFTDFDNSQSQTFRVVGRGVGIYDLLPTTQIVLGATYLGRDDIKVLPIAGVLWRPTDVWEIDAVYPRPRVARAIIPPPLVQKFSRRPIAPWLGFSPIQQYWLYSAGELGGNTWTTGVGGPNNAFTYYDLRAVVGIEQRATHGPRGRFEIGYVFSRRATSLAGGDSLLHDTIMLRAEASH